MRKRRKKGKIKTLRFEKIFLIWFEVWFGLVLDEFCFCVFDFPLFVRPRVFSFPFSLEGFEMDLGWAWEGKVGVVLSPFTTILAPKTKIIIIKKRVQYDPV